MAWVAGLISVFLVVGLAPRASSATRRLLVFLTFRASP
jgi:hypothetical protein